jgi:predicted LPLAT superfamily acyltransferase
MATDRPASPPRNLRHAQPWVTQPERGNLRLLTAMSALSLRCGRRLSRVALMLIVAYYWLRPGTAAGHIARFQRRALARTPTRRDLFSHLLAFATCTHDRIFLLNNKFSEFSVEIANEELLTRTWEHCSGCMLIGAHIGSFEVARTLGAQHPGIAVVMAMYEDNARKVGAFLAAINPHDAPDIISLGSIDSMLQVRNRLEQGAFVGILGDRTLGDEPVVSINFLGTPAGFPVGPWRAAALLRRPVLFIAGLYCGGNRYRIVVEQLADFRYTESSARDSAIHEAMVNYAGLLETICRNHPHNWFNFFDFWQELPAAPTS